MIEHLGCRRLWRGFEVGNGLDIMILLEGRRH